MSLADIHRVVQQKCITSGPQVKLKSKSKIQRSNIARLHRFPVGLHRFLIIPKKYVLIMSNCAIIVSC